MAAEDSGRSSPNVLSEDAAWRLLLALDPGRAEAADPETRSTLRISESGSWSSDPPADPAAGDLLDLFLPLRRRTRFVVGQLGQSLDGRIATVTGDSHYINGPEDIRRLHRLRALSDAVIVGAGTVRSDNPRLTVREVDGENPARVILDAGGRLDLDRNVFTDGAAPTLWICGPEAAAPVAGAASGVEVVTLPQQPGGGFDPAGIVAVLAERGLHRILVEGGGVTVSRFLEAGILDRLHVSVAPLILGSGRHGLGLPPAGSLDQALRPKVRHFTLGTDLLFDLDLSRTGD